MDEGLHHAPYNNEGRLEEERLAIILAVDNKQFGRLPALTWVDKDVETQRIKDD